jgi:hypothetical protein
MGWFWLFERLYEHFDIFHNLYAFFAPTEILQSLTQTFSKAHDFHGHEITVTRWACPEHV